MARPPPPGSKCAAGPLAVIAQSVQTLRRLVNWCVSITVNREIQRNGVSRDRHSVYSQTNALARPGKPGPEWNTMEITLDGPHTIVYLNGVKVTDYTEGQPVPPRSSASSRKEVRVRWKATSASGITATTTSFSLRKSPSDR